MPLSGSDPLRASGKSAFFLPPAHVVQASDISYTLLGPDNLKPYMPAIASQGIESLMRREFQSTAVLA